MGRSYSEKVKSRESSKTSSGRKKKNEENESSPLAPLIFLGIIVILAFGGLFYAIGGSDLFDSEDSGTVDDTSEENPDGSQQIPEYMEIQLNNVNGGTFRLQDFSGKPILLDMFAMWCEPCKYQIEELKKLTSEYGEDELVVISVDVDQREQPADINDFREEYGANWRFASYSSQLSQEFPASAIPTLYLLDHEGEQVLKHEGAKSASDLEREISPYVTPA